MCKWGRRYFLPSQVREEIAMPDQPQVQWTAAPDGLCAT